jgi:hypothetical protein
MSRRKGQQDSMRRNLALWAAGIFVVTVAVVACPWAMARGHRDHADASVTTRREQRVLRPLFKDVINDLHDIDQSRIKSFENARGLPSIYADSKCSDYRKETRKWRHQSRQNREFGN